MRNAFASICLAAFYGTILGFAYGTLWDKGCSDLIAAGAVAGCAEFVIFRYQALIGIGGVLVAAFITVAPAWRQLVEMGRQTSAQALDYFRKRSVELDREQTLIYEITSSVSIVADAIMYLANTRHATPPNAVHALGIARLQGAEKYMAENIKKFVAEVGPLWGSPAIHAARATVIAEAQMLSVETSRFSARAQPYAPITDADFQAEWAAFNPRRDSIFRAATEIHAGIQIERQRIGQRISALEKLI